MKKAKFFTAIKYALFLVVGLGISYYLFNSYYTPFFVRNIERINLYWLLLSVFSALLAHVFRAFRWQLMIKPLTAKTPPFISVFNGLMVGYLINLALPRAGELARCAWLAKKEQLNTAELVGSVIAERIFDVLILLVLVLAALLLYQDLFLNIIQFDLAIFFTQKSFLIVLAVTIIGLLVSVFLIKLSKKRHSFIATINYIVKRLWDGFISVKEVKNRVGFVLSTLAIWFFYIASSYFAFKMLPPTELLSFADALLSVVAASFGMIAPIQGGIGAFHFMVTKCLTFLGVDATAALVYATVLHASQTLVVGLFGMMAFLPRFRFSKKEQS